MSFTICKNRYTSEIRRAKNLVSKLHKKHSTQGVFLYFWNMHSDEIRLFFFTIVLLFTHTGWVFAQQEEKDSVQILAPVTLRAFEQKGNSQATAIVSIIKSDVAGNQSSLVTAVNNVPGAVMEERSPGSYRVNIRGSSLRSPFGVRNVKIYWNDIPITDPGGNTYFNQFAANNFSYIELFKGPASSMYGAGTGGLLLMQTSISTNPVASVEYNRGGYGLRQIFAEGATSDGDKASRLSYNHSKSEGYRQQTQMRKDNASWVNQFRFNKHQVLETSVLFTNLYYQTPGALTLKEFEANPAAARPASGAFLSASDAQAAIFQKTFLAGITHRYRFNTHINQATTVYGAFAQVKNSAIRNFERRNEPHFGGRTLFSVDRNLGNQGALQWSTGAEMQQGYYNIQVANNKKGKPDSLQTNDDVSIFVFSLFTQAIFSVRQKWFYTAGLSFTKSRLVFSRLSQYPVQEQVFSYKNELAPRFSVMKKFEKGLSVLATVSKGFSPPTVAELLPSTGVINNGLQAEQGWNYELTGRQDLVQGKVQIEATGYLFQLNDALAQRRDAAGADYFENSGRLKQKGLEIAATYSYLPNGAKWLNSMILQSGYALSHYRYQDFKKGDADYSGKVVPGVPAGSFSFVADLRLAKGFYIKMNYNSVSKIFLNDANTAVAQPYHLLGSLFGWKTCLLGWNLSFYIGGNNLLNEVYSLGNDINAAVGRYYNAAPPSNYYIGIRLQRSQHKRGL